MFTITEGCPNVIELYLMGVYLRWLEQRTVYGIVHRKELSVTGENDAL